MRQAQQKHIEDKYAQVERALLEAELSPTGRVALLAEAKDVDALRRLAGNRQALVKVGLGVMDRQKLGQFLQEGGRNLRVLRPEVVPPFQGLLTEPELEAQREQQGRELEAQQEQQRREEAQRQQQLEAQREQEEAERQRQQAKANEECAETTLWATAGLAFLGLCGLVIFGLVTFCQAVDDAEAWPWFICWVVGLCMMCGACVRAKDRHSDACRVGNDSLNCVECCQILGIILFFVGLISFTAAMEENSYSSSDDNNRTDVMDEMQ
eukprot:COSAG06_NODE_1092_length_10744_cov_67.135181_18_plen_267_part_00